MRPSHIIPPRNIYRLTINSLPFVVYKKDTVLPAARVAFYESIRF